MSTVCQASRDYCVFYALSLFMFLMIRFHLNAGSRDVPFVTRLIAIYAGAKWGDPGAIEKIIVKNWRLANLFRATLLTKDLLANPSPRVSMWLDIATTVGN